MTITIGKAHPANTQRPCERRYTHSLGRPFKAIKNRKLELFALKRKDDEKDVLAKGGENLNEIYKDSQVMLEEIESEGCTEMKQSFSYKTSISGIPHESNKKEVVEEHPNSRQLNFTESESASDDADCYQDLENEKHENVENKNDDMAKSNIVEYPYAEISNTFSSSCEQ